MRHQLWVEGRPKPKERPRFKGRRRVFTPEATLLAEQVIRDAWEASDGPTFEGPVRVEVDYYEHGQLITVESFEETSPLRGDIDNYLKLTMDALQPSKEMPDQLTAMLNDKSVMSVWAEKHPKGADPWQ